jgi:hypothetical protein
VQRLALTFIAFALAVAAVGLLPSHSPLAETDTQRAYGIPPDTTLHGKLQRTRDAGRIPISKLMSVLGIEVRSEHERNLGRLVDLLAEPGGKVVAAIIEFGGFLGVGTRKIAIAWEDLHLEIASKQFVAVLDIPREQLRTAPEYKPGEPTIVAKATAPTAISTKEPPNTATRPVQVRRPGHRVQQHQRLHAKNLPRSSRSQR